MTSLIHLFQPIIVFFNPFGKIAWLFFTIVCCSRDQRETKDGEENRRLECLGIGLSMSDFYIEIRPPI